MFFTEEEFEQINFDEITKKEFKNKLKNIFSYLKKKDSAFKTYTIYIKKVVEGYNETLETLNYEKRSDFIYDLEDIYYDFLEYYNFFKKNSINKFINLLIKLPENDKNMYEKYRQILSFLKKLHDMYLCVINTEKEDNHGQYGISTCLKEKMKGYSKISHSYLFKKKAESQIIETKQANKELMLVIKVIEKILKNDGLNEEYIYNNFRTHLKRYLINNNELKLRNLTFFYDDSSKIDILKEYKK